LAQDLEAKLGLWRRACVKPPCTKCGRAKDRPSSLLRDAWLLRPDYLNKQ